MSVIVRTAGIGKTKKEISKDLSFLISQWNKIRQLTIKSEAPELIYEEGSILKRTIRDMLTEDVESILVEGKEAFDKVKKISKNFKIQIHFAQNVGEVWIIAKQKHIDPFVMQFHAFFHGPEKYKKCVLDYFPCGCLFILSQLALSTDLAAHPARTRPHLLPVLMECWMSAPMMSSQQTAKDCRDCQDSTNG